MKKTNLIKVFGIASAVTAVAVMGGYALKPALANTNSSNIPTPISNIAKVFNLDPQKVMQAFNDGKQLEFETKLSELVTQGKITTEQKSKLLELHKAIETKREELKSKDLSKEEMHSQMDSVEKSLADYIESEKLGDIIPLRGRGHGHEMFESKLSSLVTEGKITSAQKDQIIILQKAIKAKHEELRSKNLTREEERSQMASVEKALTDYLSDQKLTTVINFEKGNPKGMRIWMK